MDADFDHLDGEWTLLPDQHQRTIIHIDIDCFYAQVEMVRNPELQDKPVGVKQKDLMVTCNYKARSMGVKKSMWIADAMKALPSLVLVDGSDLAPYRQVSANITSIALTFTHLVERLGLDENFLDVTEKVEEYLQNGYDEIVGHWYGDKESKEVPVADPCGCGCFKRMVIGSHIASDLRKKILEATGITCCAGVAHNKLVAKLVAGYHKPNEQTVIFPWQVYDLMNSLDYVRSIPGIGSATSKTLCDMQIVSVQDLQNVDMETLKSKFDAEMSTKIKALSFGIDEMPVRLNSRPQSLGVEDAVKRTSTVSEVREKYEVLLDRLLKLLADDGREPSTIKISVRRRFEHRVTKQFTLSSSLFTKGVKIVSDNVKSNLMNVIMNTFLKIIDITKPFELTLLGIAFPKLIDRAKDNKSSISRFFQKRSLDQSENLSRGYDENYLDKNEASSIPTNSKKLKVEVLHKRKNFFKQTEEEHDISNNSSEDPNYISNGNMSTSSELNRQENSNNIKEINSLKSEYYSVNTAVCEDFSEGRHQANIHTSSLCLPENVDNDVFNSLPKEIQEEILRSYGKSLCHGKQETCIDSELAKSDNKKSNFCAQSSFESYFKPIKNANSNERSKDKKDDLQRNRIQNEFENEPSCSFSMKKCVHSEGLDRHSASSESVPNVDNHSTCYNALPEDIDVDVFSALPKELQEEILKERKSQRQFATPQNPSRSSPHKRKCVQLSPILKYFKKV